VLPSEAGEYRASETLRIASRPWPAAGIAVAVSRSHFDEATAGFLSRFAISDRVDCGSSLKFCRIAEGSADLYPRLAPICEWDIAAGHAIVAAAGGTVVAPDGARLVYGSGRDKFRIGGCIAVGDPSALWRIVEARRPE
jgi:3'(2'), 5'-bisphosphate nucleotidase